MPILRPGRPEFSPSIRPRSCSRRPTRPNRQPATRRARRTARSRPRAQADAAIAEVERAKEAVRVANDYAQAQSLANLQDRKEAEADVQAAQQAAAIARDQLAASQQSAQMPVDSVLTFNGAGGMTV